MSDWAGNMMELGGSSQSGEEGMHADAMEEGIAVRLVSAARIWVAVECE